MKKHRGLGPKLFLSHMLVTLVGTVTLLSAALLLAPAIFGDLMGGQMAPTERMSMLEVNEIVTGSFLRTLVYSLSLAALTAALTAALSSLFVSRRIVRPVRAMSEAVGRISSGSYTERVSDAGAEDELGDLARGLNSMARKLEATERRRLDLISDISHELRTPLTTIEGYMEGLADGVFEPSDETWATVHSEAVRLRRLVDDLQELSRAESGRLSLKVRKVDPREALRRVRERLIPLFDEKVVKLEAGFLDEPGPDALDHVPDILADPDRLTQMLVNLLSNALRHTPTGGTVSLDVLSSADGMVVFSVRDTGEGIAREHLEHVFERFYRAEGSRSRSKGGAGVGLAICKALVEAAGGWIRAESPGPGAGSTFTFALPAANQVDKGRSRRS